MLAHELKHTSTNPPKPILQTKQSIENHVLGILESLPKQRLEMMKEVLLQFG